MITGNGRDFMLNISINLSKAGGILQLFKLEESDRVSEKVDTKDNYLIFMEEKRYIARSINNYFICIKRKHVVLSTLIM